MLWVLFEPALVGGNWKCENSVDSRALVAFFLHFPHAGYDTTLEQRIEKIERTNRRLRLAVLCMIGGFVALLWFGAEPSATADDAQKNVSIQQLIRARQIELVNAKGKTVMLLNHAQGRGNIKLLNDQGRKLVAFGGTSTGDGAMAIYAAKSGKMLCGITCSEKGFGHLSTYNDQGQQLFEIGADGSRGGGINAFDLSGKRYTFSRRLVK